MFQFVFTQTVLLKEPGCQVVLFCLLVPPVFSVQNQNLPKSPGKHITTEQNVFQGRDLNASYY